MTTVVDSCHRERRVAAWAMRYAVAALAAAASSGWLFPARADTDITFSYFADFKDNEMWRQICTAFESQHPKIHIKRLWYVGDTGRKLQLQLISDTAADVIMMDDKVFPAYAVRKYLDDLRTYIMRRSDRTERDLADELGRLDQPGVDTTPESQRVFLRTALRSFHYRGIQGGLPWDGNVALMFYNKDIFDREGAPYPAKNWTMSDYRSLAKRLTKDLDGDGRIDQYGTNLSFNLLAIEPIIWGFGGDLLNPEQTRCALQEPRGLEALQFIYDMKYTDRSIAWSGEAESFTSDVQLLTGRLAMLPAASHFIPVLRQVKDAMRWGVTLMPIGPYGDRVTRVTWDGVSINTHSSPEKKEAAWTFLKYVIGEESQALVGRLKRGLPIRRAQAEADYVGSATSTGEAAALESIPFGRLTPITPRYLELRDTFMSEFDRLNAAEHTHATPRGVIQELAEKVDNVLAKDLQDWSALRQTKENGPRGDRPVVKALGVVAFLVVAMVVGFLALPGVRSLARMEIEKTRQALRNGRARRQALEGMLFAAPWLAGLVLFTAFPILFSIVLSFCKWDPYTPISTMQFIGLANFQRALSHDPITGDPLVFIALYNTFYYAVIAVPLGLSLSLGLALLLNQKVRGISIFRTMFYLPSLVSGAATVILWTFILNPTTGPLNGVLHEVNALLAKSVILARIHVPEPVWLGDPHWTKPSMILMSLWGAGGAGMLIFLAGLQGVPDQLYEAAELDGAGRFRQFWGVTLPMLSPTIYFNLIMGIIGALKVFMQAYIMTDGSGGVDKSLLFYVLHLYNKAFVDFDMGYASALAWILFLIILAFTMLVIRSSAMWVHYEGEKRR